MLLIWTAADLLYCHVCMHHEAEIRTEAGVIVSAPSAQHDALVQEDHCFCCSHRVTVGSAFAVTPQHPVASVEAHDPVLAPPLTVSPLYRPPLA